MDIHLWLFISFKRIEAVGMWAENKCRQKKYTFSLKGSVTVLLDIPASFILCMLQQQQQISDEQKKPPVQHSVWRKVNNDVRRKLSFTRLCCVCVCVFACIHTFHASTRSHTYFIFHANLTVPDENVVDGAGGVI